MAQQENKAAKAANIKDLPENIRYEIARTNIVKSVTEITRELGLSDLQTLSLLESITGAIKGNFNTSAAMQALQIFGEANGLTEKDV